MYDLRTRLFRKMTSGPLDGVGEHGRRGQKVAPTAKLHQGLTLIVGYKQRGRCERVLHPVREGADARRKQAKRHPKWSGYLGIIPLLRCLRGNGRSRPGVLGEQAVALGAAADVDKAALECWGWMSGGGFFGAVIPVWGNGGCFRWSPFQRCAELSRRIGGGVQINP